MEQSVLVWGQPVIVTAYQKSKSVWIAIGEYMGERLEVKNSSATSAISLWRKTAEYRGS